MTKFEYFERTAKVIAVLAIPAVLGLTGHFVQASIQSERITMESVNVEAMIRKDYVKLAVGILNKRSITNTISEGEIALRKWAVEIINMNSNVKLPANAIDPLTAGILTLPNINAPNIYGTYPFNVANLQVPQFLLDKMLEQKQKG